jgi:hypothetical protein
MADHYGGTPLKHGGTAHHSRIISEFTIPMNLMKIGENPVDEVFGIRPPVVPGQLHTLYRGLPIIL